MEISTVSKGFGNLPGVFLPLEEQVRAFTLFQKIQEAMRHVPDFGETCIAILDAVIDAMDAENCSVMLKDPVSGELTIRAAHGKNESKAVYYENGSGRGRRFKSGEGIAGWVLKEGQALMLNDVNHEPRFVRVNGINHTINSLICFPIREKDQVVGVFNLSHSKKGAFSEGDKLTLAYISNQVGAALTSVRFFIEVKEINRLTNDSRENFPNEIVPPSHTFMEVGEVNAENGMFLYLSDSMQRIKGIIDQVANTDVTVLIQGESGAGKEVVAHSIHLNSYRREKPFVKVNCAALPQELLESELFGYEKGAFTGAYRQKLGKFELADGGTILLDEISEMSVSLQGKLLQVLQDREFSRLGGKKDIRVDARVLVATNKNLEEAVKDGRFREDLYYRLNVVNITLPPLRERKEEIPLFVEYFMDKFSKKYRKKVHPLTDKMMKAFLHHPWFGNVRELENVIQRFILLENEKGIIEDLETVANRDPISENKMGLVPSHKSWPSLKTVQREAIKKVESGMIFEALEMTRWNRKKAAEILNISYKALLYKIKECGFDKKSASPLS